MAHRMGESKEGVLRLDFGRRLKVEFHGSKVTSDAGLLPYRELDDAVGLSEIAGDVLTDTCRGENDRHGLGGQFRQSVFGRLDGYDEVNDADRLSLDMDSSVSPTHGEQEGTAYNGHFGCTCYHPLFLFNQFGNLERCSLCPGNVHSADEWEGELYPRVGFIVTNLSRPTIRNQ